MLSPWEQEEIRMVVHRELADIEYQATHNAGSYAYLCAIAGNPVFCHTPVGPILRHIGPVPPVPEGLA